MLLVFQRFVETSVEASYRRTQNIYLKRNNSNLSGYTYVPFFAGLKSHLSLLFSELNKKRGKLTCFGTQSVITYGIRGEVHSPSLFSIFPVCWKFSDKKVTSASIPTLNGPIELPNTAHVISKTTLTAATCVERNDIKLIQKSQIN